MYPTRNVSITNYRLNSVCLQRKSYFRSEMVPKKFLYCVPSYNFDEINNYTDTQLIKYTIFICIGLSNDATPPTTESHHSRQMNSNLVRSNIPCVFDFFFVIRVACAGFADWRLRGNQKTGAARWWIKVQASAARPSGPT